MVNYSMATSSADEAPRGLEFLYDRYRLNGATSRISDGDHRGQPDLIRVSCRTPHQMTWRTPFAAAPMPGAGSRSSRQPKAATWGRKVRWYVCGSRG